MDLLKNEDVQKVLQIVEGLLNGTKKLVIESNPYRVDPDCPELGMAYTHTFRIEDTK